MEKKKFKMPHTFVIIGIIILFAVALTWIIPAGAYTRMENAAGIKVIDPTQFSYIDRTPVNPLSIPLYIVKAFVKRIDRICTTQGVNLFIAFAPIMVMMAFAMGLDSLTGASIILLGGAIGFAGSLSSLGR